MKIPIGKKVRYKKQDYRIADFFKGKFKIIRPGVTRWVSPATIGIEVANIGNWKKINEKDTWMNDYQTIRIRPNYGPDFGHDVILSDTPYTPHGNRLVNKPNRPAAIRYAINYMEHNQ